MIKAIQFIDDAKNREAAETVLAFIQSQDGFIGGRVLAPGLTSPSWRVQVFFVDDDPNPVEWLPDGCRRVVIPESQALSLGIRRAA